VTSRILRVTSRALKPLLIAFSLYVLLRGHNAPGGGFVGGLLAAAGYALQAISFGVVSARRSLRTTPHVLLGAGLSAAALSGVLAMFTGAPFLTGRWFRFTTPAGTEWKLGTVMMFDAGVYLVVLGAVLLIVFSLAEE
jgi:multicomponent Na+:H+ antiporter subunit B